MKFSLVVQNPDSFYADWSVWQANVWPYDEDWLKIPAKSSLTGKIPLPNCRIYRDTNKKRTDKLKQCPEK